MSGVWGFNFREWRLKYFLDNNIDHLVSYGKILLAKRLGVSVGHPALPSTICSDFGLDIIDRYKRQLPKI